MNKEFQQLLELANKRNELAAAWYRQILTISVGALALLVGLHDDTAKSAIAQYFLVGAWGLLGIGILATAAATYSEVDLAGRLAKAFQEQFSKDLNEGNPMKPTPIIAKPRKFFRCAKIVGMTSLLGTVVCLVTYSIIRTLTA